MGTPVQENCRVDGIHEPTHDDQHHSPTSLIMRIIRSRWTAMTAVAFAVSFSFHLVERHTDSKIQAQSNLTHCVVIRISEQSSNNWTTFQIDSRQILKDCEEHRSK